MVDGRKEGEKVEKDWNYSGLTQDATIPPRPGLHA